VRWNCTGAKNNGPDEICKVTDCSGGNGVPFLGGGIVAGIVLGCIIFIILVVVGILLLLRNFRKRRQRDRSAITYATDISTISYGDDSSVNRPMEIAEDSSLERPLDRSFARNSRGSQVGLTTDHRTSHHRGSRHRDLREGRDLREPSHQRELSREYRDRESLHRNSNHRGSLHSLHRDTIHRDSLHRGSLHRHSQHFEPGDSMHRVDSWVSRDSFHRIPQVHREPYIRRGSQDMLTPSALRNSCPELDQPDELHSPREPVRDLPQIALPVQPPPYTPQDTLRHSDHQNMGYVPETRQGPAPHDVFLPPDEPPPPYDSALKDAVVLSAMPYRSHLMQSSV
jgi:hypothetical protein